jgi:PAS domain S-box-containing protein
MFDTRAKTERETQLEAENARLRKLLDEAGYAAEQAEVHGAATEERIRFQASLLDAVEQAVIATDRSGTVLYWNRFAEVLYGWRADEAVGRTVLDLKAAPEAESEAETLLAHLMRGEKWSGELVLRRKDGSTFPAYVCDAPILNTAGELIGIVGVSFDNSERGRVRQEEDQKLAGLRRLINGLTPRERQVFERVVRGGLNKQIGQELGTTERTIKAHRHNLMEKLWVRSFVELVLIAERLGLLAHPASQPRETTEKAGPT